MNPAAFNGVAGEERDIASVQDDVVVLERADAVGGHRSVIRPAALPSEFGWSMTSERCGFPVISKRGCAAVARSSGRRSPTSEMRFYRTVLQTAGISVIANFPRLPAHHGHPVFTGWI